MTRRRRRPRKSPAARVEGRELTFNRDVAAVYLITLYIYRTLLFPFGFIHARYEFDGIFFSSAVRCQIDFLVKLAANYMLFEERNDKSCIYVFEIDFRLGLTTVY